jgi:hypothetical protein
LFRFRKRETTKHKGGTPPQKAKLNLKESSKNMSEVAEGAQDVAETTIGTAFKLPQILIRGAQIFAGMYVGGKLNEILPIPPLWKFSRGTIGGALTNIGTSVLAIMLRNRGDLISALATDLALGNAANFAGNFADDILAIAGYKGVTPEGKPTKVFPDLATVLKTK